MTLDPKRLAAGILERVGAEVISTALQVALKSDLRGRLEMIDRMADEATRMAVRFSEKAADRLALS